MPTIGEIVVTAQRRAESNLQVGLTLTALSGDALAQQRVEQVLDLKGRVPNLDIKEQVPGAMPVITIRGVGLNDFGAANSPSAGVYVDQVYVASIAMMAFDMFDVERIEVLKGPQGTLYGRNSTAGALNIITRKPQQDFDAYATLGYGNYDTLDFETAVNVPLADTAALRFSAKTIQQGDGYWTSRLLPGETIGNRDLTMGRAQLALSPSDSFDLNLKVEGVRSRSEMGQPEFFGTVDPNTGGTCAPILAGHIDNTQCTDFLGYTDTDGDPFKGDWARQGVYDIDNTAVTLTMNADLGAATLTSVSGYVDFDRTVRHRRRCDAGARAGFPGERRHQAVLAGAAACCHRRAARLDRRRVLLEGRSRDQHSRRPRGSVLHAHAGHRRPGHEVRSGLRARRVAPDRQARSRHRPALHVGGAQLRRRHDRPESDRLQLPAEPDLHAGLRRSRGADGGR